MSQHERGEHAPPPTAMTPEQKQLAQDALNKYVQAQPPPQTYDLGKQTAHENYETSAIGTVQEQQYARSQTFYQNVGYAQYGGIFPPFEVPEGYNVSHIDETTSGLNILFGKQPLVIGPTYAELTGPAKPPPSVTQIRSDTKAAFQHDLSPITDWLGQPLTEFGLSPDFTKSLGVQHANLGVSRGQALEMLGIPAVALIGPVALPGIGLTSTGLLGSAGISVGVGEAISYGFTGKPLSTDVALQQALLGEAATIVTAGALSAIGKTKLGSVVEERLSNIPQKVASYGFKEIMGISPTEYLTEAWAKRGPTQSAGFAERFVSLLTGAHPELATAYVSSPEMDFGQLFDFSISPKSSDIYIASIPRAPFPPSLVDVPDIGYVAARTMSEKVLGLKQTESPYQLQGLKPLEAERIAMDLGETPKTMLLDPLLKNVEDLDVVQKQVFGYSVGSSSSFLKFPDMEDLQDYAFNLVKPNVATEELAKTAPIVIGVPKIVQRSKNLPVIASLLKSMQVSDTLQELVPLQATQQKQKQTLIPSLISIFDIPTPTRPTPHIPIPIPTPRNMPSSNYRPGSFLDLPRNKKRRGGSFLDFGQVFRGWPVRKPSQLLRTNFGMGRKGSIGLPVNLWGPSARTHRQTRKATSNHRKRR